MSPNSVAGRAAESLQLGPIGLGLAPIGNLYTQVADADAQSALAAARQQGITWFDVAPFYGFGLAEQRLGNYLQQLQGPRPVISTKVGRVLERAVTSEVPKHFVDPLPYRPVFDYSRAGIERSYDESLRRLGVERVNILLLHDVDRLHHSDRHRRLVRQLFDEALPTLQRLKAEGRVDAIGLGINEWDIGYEIVANAQIDYVLLAGRHTLLDHTAFTSGFLDACARKSISVLAGGVFNSGFLAGGTTYDYQPAGGSLLSRRDELQAICSQFDVALPAAALQFTAAHPAITSVVVGARSAQEVEAIRQWRQVRIPGEFWQALQEARLIPMEAPTPNDHSGVRA